MNEIQLTAEEIKVIQQQLNGEISAFTATPEQRTVLMGVIDKAEALMHELQAYEESGNDLIAWYYNKYKAQQEAKAAEDWK